VASQLDDREVLSQLPVLSNTYLPNLFIFCYVLRLLTFGQNINKLKLKAILISAARFETHLLSLKSRQSG